MTVRDDSFLTLKGEKENHRDKTQLYGKVEYWLTIILIILFCFFFAITAFNTPLQIFLMLLLFFPRYARAQLHGLDLLNIHVYNT